MGGDVHAMVGGSMRHKRIAMNLARLLVDRLAGSPCQVFQEGFKLHVQAADSVHYPDVFVYFGSVIATDAKLVQDASLVVEVSSDSSAEIDRRERLVAYRKLPCLRAYWVVSQVEQRVEVHDRDDRGRLRAFAYPQGDAIPAGWPGGGPIPIVARFAGTDIA